MLNPARDTKSMQAPEWVGDRSPTLVTPGPNKKIKKQAIIMGQQTYTAETLMMMNTSIGRVWRG